MPDAARSPASLRYDVNLSILFTELPLLERPAAAAAAGFDAVELWWPFAEPCPPTASSTPCATAIDRRRRAAGRPQLRRRRHGRRRPRPAVPAGPIARGSGRTSTSRWTSPRRSAAGCSTRCTATATRGQPCTRSTSWPPRTSSLAADGRAARSARRWWSRRSTPSRAPATRSRRPHDGLRGDRLPERRARAPTWPSSPTSTTSPAWASDRATRLVELRPTGSATCRSPTRPGVASRAPAMLDDADARRGSRASGYAGHVGLEYKPVGPSADSFDWLPRDLRATTTVGEAVS